MNPDYVCRVIHGRKKKRDIEQLNNARDTERIKSRDVIART